MVRDALAALRAWRLGLLAFAGLLLGVATTHGSAQAREPVSLQLRWDHQFQFAGYYAALWQGYYAAAGIDVEIRSGIAGDGTALDAIAEVASGRATFGIGASDILVARARGDPLVITASIFPTTLGAFYTRADSGITTPRQMAGHRVARRPGDHLDVQLLAVLRLEGVGLGDIVEVPHTTEGLADLAAGRVDVVPGYRITAPFYAAQLGLRLNEIRPETYGVDFYGDSLFTHADVVARDPRLVDAFREASLMGWRYALEHPEEIAARIAAEFPREPVAGTLVDLNLFQAARLVPLLADPVQSLGHVNAERWRRMMGELHRAGLVATAEIPDEAFFTRTDAIALQVERWQRLALGATLLAGGASLVAIAAYVAWLRQNVRRSRDALETSRWQLALTVDAAREGLFEWWPDTDQLRCRWGRGGGGPVPSPAPETLQEFLERVHPADRGGLQRALVALAAAGSGYVESEFRVGGGDSVPWFLLRCGMPPRGQRHQQAVFGVLLDVTRRKRAEQAMERLAMQDPLTGLANRRSFDDALHRSLAKADRRGTGVVVGLVDLDGFKPINDRFGHDRGDEVLREVARRLVGAVRAGDMAARFGGDEFALIVEEMAAEDVGPWADRLLADLAQPMRIGEQSLEVRASIGWTRYPDDASSAATLVRHADSALYRVKRSGGGRQLRYRSREQRSAAFDRRRA
jgi:diguanylate cyclase (GGDEF)-like protein